MTVLLAVGDRLSRELSDRVADGLPSFTAVIAGTLEELERAIESRPFEIAVVSRDLLDSVGAGSRALLGESEIIVVTDPSDVVVEELVDRIATALHRVHRRLFANLPTPAPLRRALAEADALSTGGHESAPAQEQKPSSLRALVERTVEECRASTSSGEEVRIVTVDDISATEAVMSRTADVLRHLVEFSAFVTNGGPVVVGVTEDKGAIAIGVTARKSRTSRIPEPPDPLRLRTLANRSDELRDALVQGNGEWVVERGEGGVTFRVRMPVDAAESALPSDSAVESSAFDLESFASGYRDSPEVMREIMRIYLAEAPERLESMRSGLAERDFARIAKAAHSLANTSGTLRSERAVAAARRLEASARREDSESARSAADELEPVVEALLEKISEALAAER